MRSMGSLLVLVAVLSAPAGANGQNVDELVDRAIDSDDLEAWKAALAKGADPAKIRGGWQPLLVEVFEVGSFKLADAILHRAKMSPADLARAGLPIRSVAALRLLVRHGLNPRPLFAPDPFGQAEGAMGTPEIGIASQFEGGAWVALLLKRPKGWKVVDATPPGVSPDEPLEAKLNVWRNYLRILLLSGDMNPVGSRIFTRRGAPVDLSRVQAARKQHYPYAEKCVYVGEVGRDLVFWDLEYQGEPYDCGMDSQVSDAPSAWRVTRYYRYNPASKKLRSVPVNSKTCHKLIVGGKIACK